MNKIRPFDEVGMPFHGLATNGILPDAGSGAKTIVDDFDWVGISVPVVHPAAPGVSRNTGQQTLDTAKGHTWRSYALLCGDNRAVNGSTTIKLGVNKWLYCDTAGGTWVIRMDATVNTTSITFDVSIESLFGRFGKARTFTEPLLDSFEWTPDIPSWYTAGTYDEGDVVTTGVDLDWINTLAFSPDGSECYINIFSTDININDDIYPETTPQGDKVYYNRSTALVGVLKVALSGTGNVENSGNGITAVITEDLAYEGGIVTNRTVGTGGTVVALASNYVELVEATPDCVGAGNGPATQTFALQIASGYTATGSEQTGGFSYTAILYKSPDGIVERTYDVSTVAAWDVTMVQPTMTRNFDVDCNCTSSSGNAAGASVEVTTTTKFSVSIALFGGTPIATEYESVNTEVDTDDAIVNVGATSYTQCPSSTPFPAASGLPSDSNTTVATINGASTTGTNMYAAHEVRQLAQNLHYVATYTSQANNEATHDMKEYVTLVDETGTASLLWSDTYTDTYRPASSAFRDLPDDRELVWGYNPVTGDSTHGQLTLFVLYSGDTYLHV